MLGRKQRTVQLARPSSSTSRKMFSWKRGIVHSHITFSPSYRLYHENVPNYLHGKPPAAIKHVMQRLTRASQYSSEDVTAGTKEGIFRIKSERGMASRKWTSTSQLVPAWTSQSQNYCASILVQYFCSLMGGPSLVCLRPIEMDRAQYHKWDIEMDCELSQLTKRRQVASCSGKCVHKQRNRH